MSRKSPFERFSVNAMTWLILLILGVPLALLNGMFLMLAVGAVHTWIWQVPTVGYWTAVVITYGLQVLSPLRSNTSSND